jgi:acyl-CoA thioester hydrolase
MPESIDPTVAVSVIRIRVRFSETDLMGIVHHPNYVSYMEIARIEWLRRRGVAYADWAAHGVHLAVVEVAVKYRSPARFDEEIDIRVALAEVGAASVRFDYRLVHALDGRLYAEGSTRLACIDANLALRRISPEIIDFLCQGERSG